MKARTRTRLLVVTALVGAIACVPAVFAFQREFRVYTSLEGYDNIPLPEDYKVPGEWVFARLMYYRIRSRNSAGPSASAPESTGARAGAAGPRIVRAPTAISRSSMRRLTRVNARSVEQPVNLDDGDDVYNWPWLCAGEMGDWKLTDNQAAKLRDYLLRGGFLMLDDFWGTPEWARFEETMKAVFPDPAHRGDRRCRRHLSFGLRPGRSLSDSRTVGARARHHVS